MCTRFFLLLLPILERIWYCVVAQKKCFPFSANWCTSHGYYYITRVLIGFRKSCSCIFKDSMLYAAKFPGLHKHSVIMWRSPVVDVLPTRPMILCHDEKKNKNTLPNKIWFITSSSYLHHFRLASEYCCFKTKISMHFSYTCFAVTSLYINLKEIHHWFSLCTPELFNKCKEFNVL